MYQVVSNLQPPLREKETVEIKSGWEEKNFSGRKADQKSRFELSDKRNPEEYQEKSRDLELFEGISHSRELRQIKKAEIEPVRA